MAIRLILDCRCHLQINNLVATALIIVEMENEILENFKIMMYYVATQVTYEEEKYEYLCVCEISPSPNESEVCPLNDQFFIN